MKSDKVTSRNTLTVEEAAEVARLSMQQSEDRLFEATKDYKPKINEFLYQMLPDSTTLKEFEELSVEVLKLITAVWLKHDR